MKKIIVALIVCIFVASPMFADLVGQKAPEIKAKKWINAKGDVSLEKFKDKVVVVEFWATWCPPCRKAIPHIVKLYNENKDKGLVVIGLTSEKEKKIKKFIKEMKMKYIVGAESQTGGAYNVRGIPHAFVIVDGIVVWEGHPAGGLDEAVEKALAERAKKMQPKKEEKKKLAEKVEAVTKKIK